MRLHIYTCQVFTGGIGAETTQTCASRRETPVHTACQYRAHLFLLLSSIQFIGFLWFVGERTPSPLPPRHGKGAG